MGNIFYQEHKFFHRQKSFLEGRENVKDEACSGRPATSKIDENVERLRALVKSDHGSFNNEYDMSEVLKTFTEHQISTDTLSMWEWFVWDETFQRSVSFMMTGPHVARSFRPCRELFTSVRITVVAQHPIRLNRLFVTFALPEIETCL